MEAGIPDSGEEMIFASDCRDRLRPGWQTDLRRSLEPITGMYRATLTQSGCKVADYHYHKRIPMLFDRADFQDTAASLKIVGCRHAAG